VFKIRILDNPIIFSGFNSPEVNASRKHFNYMRHLCCSPIYVYQMQFCRFHLLQTFRFQHLLACEIMKHHGSAAQYVLAMCHSDMSDTWHGATKRGFKPLNPELNPICYLLALLGARHFLHVSRIRVKLLTFRLLMSYIWSTHS